MKAVTISAVKAEEDLKVANAKARMFVLEDKRCVVVGPIFF